MTEKTGSKAGRWRPGESGNPNGKPKGCKHKATQLVEAMLSGEAEGIARKAIEGALAGDTTCLRLCLERLAPPVRESAITVKLPTVNGIEDATQALAAILQQVAQGTVTPGEGAAVADLLETYRRTLETQELERRVAALEAAGK
jgi:hypothetical protein